MKSRFFYYVLLIFFLTGIVVLPNNQPIFACLDVDNLIYYYFVNSSQIKNIDAFENQNKCKLIKNGEDLIITCNKNQSESIKQKLTDIKGESVSFNGTKQMAIDLINKLNLKTKFFESFDSINVYYCYKDNLSLYKTINNQKVNIQIAFNSGVITIGYPIILGSY